MFEDFQRKHRKTVEKFILEDCEIGDDLFLHSFSGDKKKDLFLVNRPKALIYSLRENPNLEEDVKTVIDYLNETCGKRFRVAGQSKKLLSAVFKNYTVDDAKKVIDNKAKSWLGGQMEPYLRPSTLFGPKFDEYLNEGDTAQDKAIQGLKQLKSAMECNNDQEKLNF